MTPCSNDLISNFCNVRIKLLWGGGRIETFVENIGGGGHGVGAFGEHLYLVIYMNISSGT